MFRRNNLGPLLLLILLLLAACGGAEPTPTPPALPATQPQAEEPVAPAPTDLPPTEVPEPTDVPVPTDIPAPTEAPEPEPEPTLPAAEPSLSPLAAPQEDAAFGRSEEGYFVRGRADAPITIIDYSDFL